MRNYKIIHKNQFACSTMQVRRDRKMPVALLQDFEEAIISQAYPVFEIVDTNKLLPEYLMMWFSRAEFDRHAEFLAVGGVRGTLEWEDFLDMELPVPSLETQHAIVKEYNVIANRIKLNEQLNQKLEETAQALYKHWFDDFEFPNENGEPYKSSGGTMVYNEELEKEIPERWEAVPLSDLTSYSKIRIGVDELNLSNYISTENMLPERKGIVEAASLPSSKTLTCFDEGDILISNIRPYFKKIWRAEFIGGCSNDILCFKERNRCDSFYLYYILEQDLFFDYVMAGSKGTKMPRGDKDWIMNYFIARPTDELINEFVVKVEIFSRNILDNTSENKLLNQFQTLLLSKMATVERELLVG
ncbi:MAG: restriction endonuclease subunit S [Pricia sp.]